MTPSSEASGLVREGRDLAAHMRILRGGDKAAEVILALCDALEAAEPSVRLAEDLAANGLRCDLTPTMLLKDVPQLYGDFAAYLQRADTRIRERATHATATAGAAKDEK